MQKHLPPYTRERADALLVFSTALNVEHRQRIVDFTTAQRVPAIDSTRSFVRQGGLMSYYTHWSDLRRRTAVYADKILKGANPVELPVEQPMKFNLVVSLKTAQALGLTILPSILVLADKVIR